MKMVRNITFENCYREARIKKTVCGDMVNSSVDFPFDSCRFFNCCYLAIFYKTDSQSLPDNYSSPIEIS